MISSLLLTGLIAIVAISVRHRQPSSMEKKTLDVTGLYILSVTTVFLAICKYGRNKKG